MKQSFNTSRDLRMTLHVGHPYFFNQGAHYLQIDIYFPKVRPNVSCLIVLSSKQVLLTKQYFANGLDESINPLTFQA